MANIGASNTPVARLIGSSPILGTIIIICLRVHGGMIVIDFLQLMTMKPKNSSGGGSGEFLYL